MLKKRPNCQHRKAKTACDVKKKQVKEMKKSKKNKSEFLKRFSIQFLVLVLLTGLNWTGFWAIGSTVAFFNDTETSSENGFTAGYLDFDLSVHEFESFIGLGEIVSKNTVLVNSGGMDFQYTLETEEVSDADGLCDALNLQAKLNGVEQYDGDLISLLTPVSTTLGTWKFNIELPVDEDSFSNGEECQFDVVFKGWQTNVGSYNDGGFTDEERMSFTITAGQMVVLNEFLPNPDGIAYGFDFGSDSDDMPQGEWVELYNNSTEAVDLTGWYLRDSTPGDGNKTDITTFNTAPATTTITGKGWLVVYMNQAIYNNTGDTVRLFNDDHVLVDSHSYAVSDFCEIEPSPGASNSEDAFGGDCADVPPNKSYARIPDGIGEWVDPIPTPGGVNVLETSVFAPSYSGGSVDFEEVVVETVPPVEEELPTPGEENNITETTETEEETTTEDEAVIDTEEEVVIEGETATDENLDEPIEEETPVEDEPIVEDAVEEEIVVEEEETIVEEETATEEEPVVVEEEIVVEPEPQPEPEAEPEAEPTPEV